MRTLNLILFTGVLLFILSIYLDEADTVAIGGSIMIVGSLCAQCAIEEMSKKIDSIK